MFAWVDDTLKILEPSFLGETGVKKMSVSVDFYDFLAIFGPRERVERNKKT